MSKGLSQCLHGILTFHTDLHVSYLILLLAVTFFGSQLQDTYWSLLAEIAGHLLT